MTVTIHPCNPCNCPVELPTAPQGHYFSSPRCVLSEWHIGDHRAADGSTSPAYPGGALAWWSDLARMWRAVGIAKAAS